MTRLIEKLSLSITDLEEKKDELEKQHDILDKYNEISDYVGSEAKKLGTSPNQEVIIDELKNIDSNEKEYKAYCYLLESDDDNIKILPQYKNARSYLETLINYLKRYR